MMSDIVERLRERHWRSAAESNDEAKERRQREREEAADLITALRAEVERLNKSLKTAVWADSEECTFLTAEVERLREALSDPVAVHLNMLRGVIAKPTLAQIIHLYGEDAIRAALEETPRTDARYNRAERIFGND